ncbi:hypothetical protein [uncultured Maritimibacter sp.]|uniref:hypothetical protein n=1 Tax=uncultured Maritimibacter sp. TaxID=991866 RepID=UPI002595C52D|nr:hypothetical protein [uncultured Maritimibacter sp.]
MKFDLIQCVVRVPHEGAYGGSEVVKTGPQAITPAEGVILGAMFDVDPSDPCIVQAQVIGSVERTKGEELERLAGIYGRARVMDIYKSAALMPAKLADLELPEDHLSKSKVKTAKAMLREELESMGVDIPKGNLSEADLEALKAEALAAREKADAA